MIRWGLQLDGLYIEDSKDSNLLDSYFTGYPQSTLFATAPSVEAFQNIYQVLGKTYQHIVVIVVSSQLSCAHENAIQAARNQKSAATIQVIDSQSCAVGTGFLVHAAAEALQRGLPVAEITRTIRGLTRQIYAIFCLPDLTYLARAGQLDPAQAVVGEMLGILPLFILENGRLVHTNKIRSPRHMTDIMFEFIAEFEHLRLLSLVQGVPYFEQESRNIRERIQQNNRSIPFHEHSLPPSLAAILGPRAIGLMAIENAPKGG